MFTFKFFHNPKNDSIHIRFINNRKKAEMETELFGTEDALEDALSSHPKSKNMPLVRILSAMVSILRKMQYEYHEDGKSDEDVKVIRDDARRRLLHRYALQTDDTEIDETRLFGKFYRKCVNAKANRGYKESCQYTLKKMIEFCSNTESDFYCDFDRLTFEDITLKWLNGFDEWLTKKGAAKNSRNIHFKNIRTAINRAIDEELTDKYPFRRFKIRAEETRKRSLTVEDLRRLFDYPVEDYQRFYVDMFKLTFFLIGINAVDLYNLERIDNGRIEYRRAKTKRLYSIKVEPEAMEIINKYRGEKKLLNIADRWKDHRDFTKNINIALKKIGKVERKGRGGKKEIKAEWKDLTLYWTRHTWATIAADIDVPDATISLALGHKAQNSTTEIYIRRNQKKVDEANRKVLDYVLHDKRD